MSIDSVLRKEGIEDIEALDTLTVNKIAKRIAKKLVNTFGEHNLDESELFISISRLKMYFAKMPEDMSGAKYSYINNAIYFNNKLKMKDIEESAIHECIHYLQEIKDEKGNLLRLGLCNYAEEGEKGLALNEAAVQLMAAEASGTPEDKVKYYELFLATKSPDYYPLECVLLNEMVYFTGTYPLYQSTLYSNDIFKNTFSSQYGKKTYDTVKKAINNILEQEANLSNETLELQYTDSEKRVNQINKNIENIKKKIAELFLKTQDCIMKNCFNKDFQEVRTMEDLQNFKEQLYHFKDIIGFTADYNTYNDFYIQKMQAFEKKKEYIENYGEILQSGFENQHLELVEVGKKISLIRRILMKLGILVSANKNEISYNK